LARHWADFPGTHERLLNTGKHPAQLVPLLAANPAIMFASGKQAPLRRRTVEVARVRTDAGRRMIA
jgi:hypothetical protein